jgi:uncharacterized membrane protein YcgQ (UPF0703/DUF1980 family)
MLKFFLKAVRKSSWKIIKGIGAVSLINASFWFVLGFIDFLIGTINGAATFSTLITNFGTTFLMTFQVLLLICIPFVIFYSLIKSFFQNIFSLQDEKVAVLINNKKNKGQKKEVISEEIVRPITVISKRKTEIQKKILSSLEQHKEKMDIQEIHTLERINEELLNKTDEYYHSLDTEKQAEYENEVLKRFNELEGKALLIVSKFDLLHEKSLQKQLHIIDQTTK